MENIRKDLIDKELKRGNKSSQFHYQKLSNKFLDWLFRHYYILELTEHFYDSEPDIPVEWQERNETGYIWDDKEFRKLWRKLCEEHEEKRIQFCNWIEVFGRGIWFMSQKTVDKISKDYLKRIRSVPIKRRKERIYLAQEKDYIFIYWYCRDIEKIDIWWIMKKKTSERRRKE